MSDYLPPVVVELEGRHAQLLATLNTAKAEVRNFTAEVGRMKASIGVKLDLGNGERQKVQQAIGQIRGTARVGLRIDESTVAAARTRIDELTRDRDITARVGVALDIAPGEIQRLQERIGRIKATVRVLTRLDAATLTASRSRLDDLAEDRTVTIRTRVIDGGGSGGGAGRGSSALMALVALSPALVPIAAQAATVTASLGAATVAVGAFGVAAVASARNVAEVAEAQTKAADAAAQYGATSQQAAQAQAELTRTLASQPAAVQRTAAAWTNLKTTTTEWSDSLASFTLKPVEQGMGILEAVLPKLTPLVKETSTEFTRLTTLLGGGVNSAAFDDLMSRFTAFADGALTRGVDKAVHFARVLSEGGGDGAFTKMLAYAEKHGPLVEETLSNLGGALSTVLEGASEAGPGLLTLVNAGLKLVDALPPSLVSVLLQIAAGMKLVALARAGIAATAVTVTSLSGRLTDLRSASNGATSGLARLRAAFMALSAAGKATVILAALAAVGVAVAKIATLGRDAPPDVDRLTNSLGRLGDTGRTQGEALKQWGADLGGLSDSIKSFVDPSTLDNVQQGIVKVLTAGTTDSTPVKEAKEQVDAIDKSLASLVSNGNADLAAAALEKLKAAYAKDGGDVSDFTGKLTEYNKAVDDAKFAAELAAQSQGLFGAQAQETKRTLDEQKASADGLRESLQALNDVQRSALDGQIGLEAAMDAAAKAAKEHGQALTMKDGQLQVGTQKARDQATALSDLATKTDEAAATARENGARWSEVNSIYDQGRSKLIEYAQQMGLNKDQAKQLADQILKVPDKTARIKMEAEDAKADLDAFIAKVKKSPSSKSVTLKTLSESAEKLLESFGYKVTHLKDGSVTVSAKTGTAVSNIGKVQSARDKLSDKSITITTNKVTVISTIVRNSASSQADALRKQAENFSWHGGLLRRADGGSVQYFPRGGYIDGPGTPTSDSILAQFGSGAQARVSDSEYVIQAAAVRKYGVRALDAINDGQLQLPALASGGLTTAQKEARAGIKNTLGISTVGQWAGYQLTPMEKSLATPEKLGDLVTSLNQLHGQIKKAFTGKTESSLLKKWEATSKALVKYEKKLSAVNASLEKAKDKLDELKDAAAQVKSQVATSVLSGTGVVMQASQQGLPLTAADVVANQKAQLQAVQQFAAQLEILKKRGLSGDLLQQIASAGVEQGGATAAALIGASDAQLAQLNSMNTSMENAANKAGTTVADAMYGAGIAAAEGLVAGLEKQQQTIENQMLKIAKSMENALKSALGIKSPSRVMAKLGDFSALGFAQGLDRSRKHAVVAAQGLAMSVQQGAALTASSSLPAIQPDTAAVVHYRYEPQITVEGHVLTERNLRDLIQEQMLQYGSRNSTTYAQFKR